MKKPEIVNTITADEINDLKTRLQKVKEHL